MMYFANSRSTSLQRPQAQHEIDVDRPAAPQFVRSAHPSNPVTAADVERICRARQLRAKFIDESLFADPAWDMLLDLYKAHLAQHRICTTSVCFGSGAPVSTALRWLNALEERGLVQRSKDPLDGRRYFVALSDAGVVAMSTYFAAAQGL